PSARMGRLTAALLVVGALAGCAVGPDYARPDIDVGAAYRQAGVAPEPQANAGWVQARPGVAPLRTDWWTLYGDATLNELIATLLEGDVDVQLAAARYQQAQAAVQSARSGFFATVGSDASVDRCGGGSGAAGGGVSNTYALSAAVSWEIDLWGRVRRSVEAGRAAAGAQSPRIGAGRLRMPSALAQTHF